jgi:AcrR family transcriptional regulator
VKISKPCARPNASASQIKEAAIELACEGGWNKLTVRALAEKLGYTPPILYQYFHSKDHLLQEIMNEGFAQLSVSMEAAVARTENASKALVAAARARFQFAERQPALHSLMFGSGSPCWQRETTFKGMLKTGALITGLLQAISGRNDDCHDLKINVVALIKGYTYFATEMSDITVQQQFFPHTKPEEALAQAMERFIISIQKINLT